MTPYELWLFLDAKRPEIRHGNMRERDLIELSALLNEGDYL